MEDNRIHRHPLGFFQANEIPSDEDLQEYYAEKYFQSGQGNYRSAYSQVELNFFKTKIHQKFTQAQDLGYFKKPGRLLDVGCGEGFTLSYFRNAGWKVEGLDYSAAGVTAMNPDCLDALEVGDVMKLLRQKLQLHHHYDAIWLSNVLEHVRDPVNLLEQLMDLLGDRGLLVVTVPNDFSALQKYLINRGKVELPYWIALPDHLTYFDKDSLQNTAMHVGYKVLAILADFPIDWFLMHPHANYIQNRTLGSDAHSTRLDLEALIAMQPISAVNEFYRSMANIGMGRDITAFMSVRV
jgi:2-polyprenyl-3-methyl-5-hydroxy-6-metoxy-1,4-benzoquinol methylase